MMNQTLESMLAHRSIRAYQDKPVADQQLELLLQAVQRAPSSINGQGLSVVVVRDAQKRARIAALAGNQRWIAQAPVFLIFILDLYKTMLACERAGKNQAIHESVEGLLTGSVDVGIALGTAIAAAESMGLGTVPIGGVRQSSQEMIDLLELPAKTFPLVGLCLGHPAAVPEQKPRLGMAAFRHDETYQAHNLPQLIEDYDQVMSRYLAGIGRAAIEVNWTQWVASIYGIVYHSQVLPVLRRQGFSFER